MHLPAWPALQKDRMRHLFTQVRSRQQGPPPRPRAQPRRGPRTAVQAGAALRCWGRADCRLGALICPPVTRHTCPLSLAGGARRDLQHHMNDAEQHRMTNAHDQSATLLRPDTTRPLPAGLPLGVPVLGCGAAPAGLAGVSAALPCCDCASAWPLPEEGAALPLFGIKHSPQARVLLQDPVEVLRSTPRLHGRPHVARSAFGAQGAAWPCCPHALPGADQTPDPTDVISGALHSSTPAARCARVPCRAARCASRPPLTIHPLISCQSRALASMPWMLGGNIVQLRNARKQFLLGCAIQRPRRGPRSLAAAAVLLRGQAGQHCRGISSPAAV